MDKFWNIVGPASLLERGNPLLDPTPLELSNAYMLSEGALQMRQGFSTENYSASGLDGPVEWIARHVTNTGAEEAWASSDNAGTAELGRRSGGVWGPQTFSDTANANNLRYMNSATQNGKLFLAYDSNVNRLHVWDGTVVRRVGLITATAPTVASLGGAGITGTRFYRQRNTVQVAGITTERSEPSTSVSLALVDDVGWRVTKGAVSGDGETHWEVEAANAAAGPWYRIATVVVGTTTYDDTAATIPTTFLSDSEGLYVPPPSVKYIISDGAVLLMAGAWETTATAGETTPKQNRVWFTRPLGASDVSDDESIPQTGTQNNYIDDLDAGPITGLAGPVYGEIYVFKATSFFKLVPTGDLDQPYARVPVSDAYGAVDQRLITSGDLAGSPAIFFTDQTACYALTSGGVQSISEGIARDLRQTFITPADSFLIFDPIQRILLLQVSSSASAAVGSYRSFTFDTAKQRWSGFGLGGAVTSWILGVSLLGIDTYLGGSGAAIIHGAFLDDPNGGRRIYLVGQATTATGSMFKWGGRVAQDAEAAYTTSARYRRAFAAENGKKVTVGNPTVWYRNPQGTTTGTMTLQLSYILDDTTTITQSQTLEATDDESGIASKRLTFESLTGGDAAVVDLRMSLSYSGSPFSSVAAPAIDAIQVPYIPQEHLAQ